jgi:hypothetical protein
VNLGQCRTRTRFYLNEDVAAQFTDAQVNDMIVAANQEIYAWLVAHAPDLFLREDRFTWTANTVRLVLDTVVPADGGTIGRWLKIMSLFRLTSSGDVSATNYSSRLEKRDSIWELYDQHTTDAATVSASSTTGSNFRFAQVGRTLFMLPIPSIDIYLWTHMIPVVFDPAADANQLLSIDAGTTAEYTEHHDLIAMLAALKCMCNTRDQSGLGTLSMLYQAKRKAAEETFGTLQLVMEPRKVNPRNR